MSASKPCSLMPCCNASNFLWLTAARCRSTQLIADVFEPRSATALTDFRFGLIREAGNVAIGRLLSLVRRDAPGDEPHGDSFPRVSQQRT